MSDKDLIKRLGGATKLARRLGLNVKAGGVQRVQNWTVRGIPARILLDYPEVFREAPDVIEQKQKAA